jgi:hypothetical protein
VKVKASEVSEKKIAQKFAGLKKVCTFVTPNLTRRFFNSSVGEGGKSKMLFERIENRK